MILLGLLCSRVLGFIPRFAFAYTLFNLYGLNFVETAKVELWGRQYTWPFLTASDSLFTYSSSAYFALEGVFFLYLSFLKYGVYNYTPEPLPVNNSTFPRARRQLLFKRQIGFLKQVGVQEGKQWLQGWFFGKE